VGGGVSAQLSGGLPGLEGKNATIANALAHLGSGGASALANAGTRSLIDGSDFGDNIIAALPDVIGNTVGQLAVAGVRGIAASKAPQPPAAQEDRPFSVTARPLTNGPLGLIGVRSDNAVAAAVTTNIDDGAIVVVADRKRNQRTGLRAFNMDGSPKFSISARTAKRYQALALAQSKPNNAPSASGTKYTNPDGLTFTASENGNDAMWLIAKGFIKEKGGLGTWIKDFHKGDAKSFSNNLIAGLKDKGLPAENAVMFMLGYQISLKNEGSAFMQEVASLMLSHFDPSKTSFSDAFGSAPYVSSQQQQLGAGFSTGLNSDNIAASILARKNAEYQWYQGGGLTAYANAIGNDSKWIGPRFLAYTASAAGGLALAPVALESGGAYLANNFNWATTTGGALIAKGGLGGGFNLAYSGITKGAFEREWLSKGEAISSFATGALFAPGMLGVRTGNGLFDGAATGGFSAFSGELGTQLIDQSSSSNFSFNSNELFINTAIGIGAGGLGGTVKPYYSYRPSIGNSQTFNAGFNHGVRVYIDQAPQTIVTYGTQLQLDIVKQAPRQQRPSHEQFSG
jgi:hypothetical protein